jgi:hypothetical protein
MLSALPDEPAVPASVVTTPLGVTFRMVVLLVSATKTLPDPSTATPLGQEKRAAAPVPSTLPDEPAVPGSTTPRAAGLGSEKYSLIQI